MRWNSIYMRITNGLARMQRTHEHSGFWMWLLISLSIIKQNATQNTGDTHITHIIESARWVKWYVSIIINQFIVLAICLVYIIACTVLDRVHHDPERELYNIEYIDHSLAVFDAIDKLTWQPSRPPYRWVPKYVHIIEYSPTCNNAQFQRFVSSNIIAYFDKGWLCFDIQ